MEASLQHRPKQPFHGSLGRCCFGNSMLMIPQEVTAWPTNNDGSKMLTDKEGTEKGAYLAVLCKMYDINENATIRCTIRKRQSPFVIFCSNHLSCRRHLLSCRHRHRCKPHSFCIWPLP